MKSRIPLLAGLLGICFAQAQTPKAQLSFATDRVTVSEGAGSVLIEIRRSRVLDTAVSVRFSIAGNPKHCLPTTNLVEFAAGETNRFVPVILVDDEVANFEEWVGLELIRTDTNTLLGAISSVTLIIQDDDRITMGLRTYPTLWDETNGVRMLQAYRSGGLNRTAEVSVAVSFFGSASDVATTFVPSTRRLTFLPGVTNLEVPVVLRRDYAAQFDQVVQVRLLNPDPANSASGFPPNSTIRNVDARIDFLALPILTETNETVDLPIYRFGPTNLSASVDLITLDDTAKAGRDYELPARIEFAPGQRETQIPLRLFDNSEPDGARSFRLILANPTGVTSLAESRTMSIADDEAGPVSGVEVLPEFASAGFDSRVTSLRLRPDGRLLVAGEFSKFGETTVKSVAVVNPDGSLEPTFNAGSGPNRKAHLALPLSDNRVLVLGTFSSFAGQDRKNAVRLLSDGSVDPDFRLDFSDAPSVVAPTAAGGWWLGGYFGVVNGELRNWLLRVLPDGTPDPTWHGDTNLTHAPLVLAITASGQLVHSGGHILFSEGAYGPSLVRIGADGSLDSAFAPQKLIPGWGGLMELADGSLVTGEGQRWLANGTYDLTYKKAPAVGEVLANMPDGTFLLGQAGNGGRELRRLRLDGNGNAGDFVQSNAGNAMKAVVLSDESVMVTGSFTALNGQPRQRIARLRFPEPTATTVSWHGRRFGGEEDHGPIRVPVLRRGNLATSTTVAYASRPREATPGKDFESTAGSVTFAPGERLKFVELTPLADEEFETDESLELVLSGEAVDSSGAVATVVLQSDEARVHFATAESMAVEGGKSRIITIQREGGLAYPVTINLGRAGTATDEMLNRQTQGDYIDSGGTEVVLLPEQTVLSIYFTPRDDALAEGTESIVYRLQVPASATHPVALTEFNEHVVKLSDDDGGVFAREMLGGNSGIFARAGGGLWLQTSFGRASEPHSGPTALTPDGSPDPEFTLSPVDAGSLLQPLADGRTLVSQFVGRSLASFTNRILRLLPNGQRDAAFTPLLLPDSRTPADGYAHQYSPAVAPDGSLAVVTWERGTLPTSKPTRGLVVQRFTQSGGTEALWTNTELMGSGNFDSIYLPATGPLPEAAFLDSGSLLLIGRMQFRWQTNSGIFANSYPIRPLVRMTPAGVVDPDYVIELSRGWVRRLAPLPGGRCLIAGDFFRVNGHLRPGLARLLPDGNVDLTFEPELPSAVAMANQVFALATGPTGQVWLSLSGQADGSGRVVGLDAQGKALPGFVTPVFNGPVYSIVPLADGKVVVSGYFDLAGEAGRLNYAWLDATGKVLPAAPLAWNLIPTAQPGSLRARWGARFTGPVTLESSTDFETWLPVRTFDAAPGEADLELPESGPAAQEFYRLRR